MENQTILNTGATTEDSLRTVINDNGSQNPVSLFTTGSIIDNRYQVISRINRNSGEADIYKVADLQDNDAVKALKLFHRRDAIKDEVVKRLLLKIYLNILKHTERLKSLRILLTVSTCMLWLLQAIRYSQVLVHSTVVNSRNSLRYHAQDLKNYAYMI